MRSKWFLFALVAVVALSLSACSGGGKKKKKGGGGAVGLSVTTTSLADGVVAQPYSATLAATGGTSPYTWAVTTGTLPSGLQLNASTGAITGAPTAAATTNLTFTVTDSTAGTALTATADLSITVTAATSPVSISTTTLASGTVGVAYSQTLAATGGTAPYTFSVAAGSTLPAGLNLDANSGAVFGTPSTQGTSVVTFTATDSAGTPNSGSKALSITIAAGAGASSALTIFSTSVPDGRVGVDYNFRLSAGGGVAPYTWAVTTGTLPTGMQLGAATGILSNTGAASITTAGATDITVTVTDSAGTPATDTQDLTITINAAPAGADDSWTIIVYGHGDHNLEPSLIADIDEMEAALAASTGTVTFNIIVLVDINSAPGCEIWEVQADGNDGLSGATTTDISPSALGELNLDDPQNLTDFIEFCVDNYPADHYGLVMWNHGGQWDGGFGGNQDNGSGGSGDGMSVAEMTAGIEDAFATATLTTAGVTKFDFMTFDTCLMGGAELLSQFAPYCGLYIACPEIDFGAGWDYAATLEYLHENPRDTLRAFGAAEVTHWQAHHTGSTNDNALRAHAAYDTAQVAALESAINQFATALNASYATEANIQRTARAQTVQYNYGDVSELAAPQPYMDIGHFASLISAATAVAAVETAADNLVTAINASVIGKSMGSERAGALGLSIWLPANSSNPPAGSVFTAYGQLVLSQGTAWDAYVNTWFTGVVADTTAPVATIDVANSDAGDPTDLVTTPAHVEWSMTGDVTSIEAYLGQEDATPGIYNLYGHVVDATGVVVYSAGGPGSYELDWDGTALAVDDGAGGLDQFCGFLAAPDSDVMFSYATLTRGATTIDVLVTVDLSVPGITSVLDDSGTSPREITVQAGDVIEFSFVQIDTSTGDTTLVPTGFGGVTVGAGGLAGLTLTFATLPDGDYDILAGGSDDVGNSDYDTFTVTVGP